MENKDKSSAFYKLLILTAAVVPLIISLSYAYFVARIKGNETSTVVNVGAVTEGVNISLDTENDGYIYLRNAIPIIDEQKEDYAGKSIFTVRTGANEYNAKYSIQLTDITIGENLKPDLKWELRCTTGSNTNSIASGNFASYTSGNILLKDNLVLAPSSSEDYELLIWIAESGEDQSYVMNQTFSAKVMIEGEYTR